MRETPQSHGATDSMEAALVRVLNERDRLRKNGETWTQYIAHIATPQRIGWLALALCQTVTLAFMLGGRVQRAQQALQAATDQAVVASARADSASAKADAAARALVDIRQQLAQVLMDNEQHAKRDVELKDRVSQSVTRADFGSVIERQILPRLERIEQRVWENRPR